MTSQLPKFIEWFKTKNISKLEYGFFMKLKKFLNYLHYIINARLHFQEFLFFSREVSLPIGGEL